MKLTKQLISDLEAVRLSIAHVYREELCDHVEKRTLSCLLKEIMFLEAEMRTLKSRLGLTISVDRI